MEAERQQRLQSWVAAALGEAAAALQPASSDASSRRYFRTSAQGRSYVVMDAPPAHGDCRPFLRIAALLKEAGLHPPDILAEDLPQGFLLLEDLGPRTYLEALDESNADRLFGDAISALILWQRATRNGVLPPYDRALLHRELMLFPEWYVTRHLMLELSSMEMMVLQDAFKLLEDSALAQPQVYVHRDYMPRNLMVSEPNPGVLDFQDAVMGPVSYDITSLFRDAFVSWPEDRVRGWRLKYWDTGRHVGLPLPAKPQEFERASDWMGMQRHLKVLGIFARLHYRDGKSHYLKDAPRFLRYLAQIGHLYKEFTPFLKLLDSLERRAQNRVPVT